MTRRKDELSANRIGRERPEQVAQLSAIRSWATTTISSANSAVGFRSVRAGHGAGDHVTYGVFCLAGAARAEGFCERFGGEHVDTKDRGRSSAWFPWRKS